MGRTAYGLPEHSAQPRRPGTGEDWCCFPGPDSALLALKSFTVGLSRILRKACARSSQDQTLQVRGPPQPASLRPPTVSAAPHRANILCKGPIADSMNQREGWHCHLVVWGCGHVLGLLRTSDFFFHQAEILTFISCFIVRSPSDD